MDRAALASTVDHTLLKPEATDAQVAALVAEAAELGAFSVCVSPSRLPLQAPAGLAVCTRYSTEYRSARLSAAKAAAAAGSASRAACRSGGTVAVLGGVGDNFGAGFTGGMAFVYDPDDGFERRVNPETLTWQRVSSAHWDGVLRGLVERHAAETSSRFAAGLLHDWPRAAARFWQVVPKEYVKYLDAPLSDAVEARRA